MSLSPISLFGANFVPTLHAEACLNQDVPESVITVTDVSLDGGSIARYANNKFTVNCTTKINIMPQEDGLIVECSLIIKSPVSEQFKKIIPGRLMSGIGSKVMGKVLRFSVRTFGEGLQEDFEFLQNMLVLPLVLYDSSCTGCLGFCFCLFFFVFVFLRVVGYFFFCVAKYVFFRVVGYDFFCSLI
ncbi:hypothetical protein TrST_g13866 [Triparma strigata]|uniref:Uncharacterized protein n=1 Tax=Triparma strigata TaxID=1606541 RepID=A0A9W7B0K0_9STRA|nr:hypothetical protein TrST_g13866 [Triparma strigata]